MAEIHPGLRAERSVPAVQKRGDAEMTHGTAAREPGSASGDRAAAGDNRDSATPVKTGPGDTSPSAPARGGGGARRPEVAPATRLLSVADGTRRSAGVRRRKRGADAEIRLSEADTNRPIEDQRPFP